jgi:hypothetical protein
VTRSHHLHNRLTEILCLIGYVVDAESTEARSEERKAHSTGRERIVDHARGEREHAKGSAHLRSITYAKVSSRIIDRVSYRLVELADSLPALF